MLTVEEADQALGALDIGFRVPGRWCGRSSERLNHTIQFNNTRTFEREAFMRTYYVFHAASSPDLRGYTYDPTGGRLPAQHGPWTRILQIDPDEEWTQDVSRAVVAGGILESGYYLWGPVDQSSSLKPIIESDRVEGTAVYNRDNHQIGTIQRLLIEKVSGRVLYVDVTFGGFMGLGVHHLTIPWGMLTYDRELEGYHTDITESQVQGAPAFYSEDRVWPGPEREEQLSNYWNSVAQRVS
ncbi:PRC-barrel domain-containing protein [Methylobacterium nigriterrae]|uniref:PRC-barrel domain-containing protein n=1 Tax=Methylobacterium nigriterrae TaxID=3127512 RepID=UPI0030137931